jgi:hypothetical protein
VKWYYWFAWAVWAECPMALIGLSELQQYE